MRLLKRHTAQISLLCALLVYSSGLPASAQSRSVLRQGLPGRRISGGTRGECMSRQPVIALIPSSNLGITTSDRPSVYFVVPEFDSDYPVEFKLRSSKGETLYVDSLNTADVLDIVGIELPEQSLKAEQDYQWYFSVICNAEDRSQDIVLSGWLRQASPDIVQRTSPAEAVDNSLENAFSQAESYQRAGLWTDVVETLARLRQQHPDNREVQQAWVQLLKDLDEETVALPPETRQAAAR